MECRRRKLPRAGTRHSSILSYVLLVHITCDAKPLIASRSLTMQSSERAAAIHSATPFQVTRQPRSKPCFANRRGGDSPKLLDPTQTNPIVA